MPDLQASERERGEENLGGSVDVVIAAESPQAPLYGHSVRSKMLWPVVSSVVNRYPAIPNSLIEDAIMPLYMMFQTSSAALQNFPQATLALRLKLLILIVWSLNSSAKSSLPLAIAPTKTQMLCSGPRSDI